MDTGEVRQLTTPPPSWIGDSYGAFSPDGRNLAIVRTSAMSVLQIYLLPLSPDYQPLGEPRLLTDPACKGWDPAWMPNGRELLYTKLCAGETGVWRLSLDGMREELVSKIGRLPSQDFTPQFHPGETSWFSRIPSRTAISFELTSMCRQTAE